MGGKKPLRKKDKSVAKTAPKTTPTPAFSRREAAPARTVEEKVKRKFGAVSDRIDIRDWFYHPTLHSLPDQVVNVDRVPEIWIKEPRERAPASHCRTL